MKVIGTMRETAISIPNGMTTAYSYDNRNLLTKIEHKDGETVLDGFTYTLSTGGNVVTTAHADGSEWAYEYDGRDRLTKAERDNDGDTITATYEYTYDDGDNLVTKVEPFFDDFNDTNYTGWTVGAGTWSASSGAMRNTVTSESWSYFSRSQSDADHDLQFTYVCNDDSDSGYTLRVEARFTGWSDDRLCLYIEPTRMILKEMVDGGSWTWLSTNTSADTEEGTEYIVRMECDDDDITVWRGEVGGGMSQVLSTSSATVTSTNSIYFDVSPDADYSVDSIRLIADDLSTTTTFAYDDANELTSMTNNGTVSFAYDDWGRTISKWQGDFDATYAYRYGSKLYSITSDFNGEGTLTYQYGGDGKRRQRTANSVTTKYRWDAGWNMINEENVLDALTMTYVMSHPAAPVSTILAEITGTLPSSGTPRYYCHDHLGSTRRLRASDKSSAGQYEFTPYGCTYVESGIALSALGGAFTGKPWDQAGRLYHFPYRYYSPPFGRWLTRDPLRMADGPNAYFYGGNDPVSHFDPRGLKKCWCTTRTETVEYVQYWKGSYWPGDDGELESSRHWAPPHGYSASRRTTVTTTYEDCYCCEVKWKKITLFKWPGPPSGTPTTNPPIWPPTHLLGSITIHVPYWLDCWKTTRVISVTRTPTGRGPQPGPSFGSSVPADPVGDLTQPGVVP